MQCRQPSCPQGFTQREVRNLVGQRYDALLVSAGPQIEIGAAFDRLQIAFCPAGSLIGFKPWIRDRKSTRLNSSHVAISYAVFCLKKKKSNRTEQNAREKEKRR